MCDLRNNLGVKVSTAKFGVKRDNFVGIRHTSSESGALRLVGTSWGLRHRLSRIGRILNENEWIGRRVIELGWLGQDLIAAAYQKASAENRSLAQVLLESQSLTREQVQSLFGELAALRSGSGSSAGGLIESHSRAARSSGRLSHSRVSHSGMTSGIDRTRLKKMLQNGQKGALKGKELGPYTILKELTRGGMGIVLVAEHNETKREVALKLMLSDDPSSEAVKRFEREARALSSLDHPRIVKVLEFGHNDGIPWFAMELINGQTLEDQVRDSLKKTGAVPHIPSTIANIAEVADALAYCHSCEIIHRDIKPSNIVIEKQTGRPVLLDFGLVKRDPTKLGNTFKELELTVTVTQEGVGTPAYMSPEQLDPHGEFGPTSDRADTWGLGATLFYCLTGEPPYGGRSSAELYAALATQEARKVRSVNAEVPEWVAGLVHEALVKPVEKRPKMSDWLESLRAGPPKNAALSKLLIVGPIILLLAVVGVIVTQVGLTRREPLALKGYRFDGLKKDKAGEYWTSAESLSIAGQLSWGPVLVQVGSLKFQAKEDGRFSGQIKLKEGSNDLTLSAGPSDNQIVEKVLVYCDRAKPKVTLKGEIKGANLILSSRVLAGKVIDDGRCELQIDGIGIELDEDGRFSLKVKNSEKAEKLNLLATDQAGNKTSQSWTLWTKKSLKTLTKKALQRRKTWVATEPLIQNLVIENVASRLGDDYQWLRTETYNGPGDKSRGHRLATFLHKKTGVELQLLPGDRYQMGTSNPEEEARYVKRQWPEQTYVDVVTQEIPAHSCLIEPFLLGRLELTQKQWDLFKLSDKRKRRGEELPIDGTTWDNAKKWLKLAGGKLRLPSESEWEYACRAGTKTRFYWGDSLQFKYIWTYRNSRLQPRGAKFHDKAGLWNGFGLVDMSGNVAEWCEDPFTTNYKDGPNSWRPKKIAKDSVFSLRVVRGGNVKMKPLFSRTTARDYEKPDVPQPYVGFRVARSLPR